MHCFIYKSPRKEELYLFVKEENNFSEIPEPLMTSFGTPEFVMDLDIHPERQLARSTPEDVLAGLEQQGFFLQMPPPDPTI